MGVAYKLVQALAEEMPERLPYPEEFLDLVALGTVADMAPLRDENRTFVAEGLEALRRKPSAEVCTRWARLPAVPSRASTPPTLPLATRRGSMPPGGWRAPIWRCSCCKLDQPVEAESVAHELDNLNIERRRLTQLVLDAAAAQIDPAKPLVFAIGDEFPLGVVGLAAGRLVEQTGLPAFVGACM